MVLEYRLGDRRTGPSISKSLILEMRKGELAMSGDARPILSIIVRRFGSEYKDAIMHSLGQLQKAAADQTGYLGDHNSLSKNDDYYELVNVFAFDLQKALERWENSDMRTKCLADLDRHPQEATNPTQLGDFAELLRPKSKTSKIEVVLILIFWIVVLGEFLRYLAGLLLPENFSHTWSSILLISVNVVLISYFFLPWSNHWLTKLKTQLSRKTPNE